MIQLSKDNHPAAALFGGWPETLIWSCLQNVMGQLYVDDPERPASALALLGDFAFFAGAPNRELALFKPEGLTQNFIIMTPQNDAWAEMIESCWGEQAKKVTRYAFRKEPEGFDRTRLAGFAAALPAGYELKLIDEVLYHQCLGSDWSRDLVSLYPDYETYRRLGLGVVVLKDGLPVSGASSYASYLGGIEIEIDTQPEHRRRGLARACGARLILECLDRGFYPSWDAQNLWSAALAEQLGYHLERPYTAYEIRGY